MWHFNGFKDTDSILRVPLNSIFIRFTDIYSKLNNYFVCKQDNWN